MVALNSPVMIGIYENGILVREILSVFVKKRSSLIDELKLLTAKFSKILPFPTMIIKKNEGF